MHLAHLVFFQFFDGAQVSTAEPEPTPAPTGEGGAGEPGGGGPLGARRRRDISRGPQSPPEGPRTNRGPQYPEEAENLSESAQAALSRNDERIALLREQRDGLERLEKQLGDASEQTEARQARIEALNAAIDAYEEENEAILVMLLLLVI